MRAIDSGADYVRQIAGAILADMSFQRIFPRVADSRTIDRLGMETPVADDDPVIITSDLSRIVEEDGLAVEVNIFRLETEANWNLEVVNEGGTSTVWEDTFATEELAFEVFERTVATEGMSTFLDETAPPTLH